MTNPPSPHAALQRSAGHRSFVRPRDRPEPAGERAAPVVDVNVSVNVKNVSGENAPTLFEVPAAIFHHRHRDTILRDLA